MRRLIDVVALAAMLGGTIPNSPKSPRGHGPGHHRLRRSFLGRASSGTLHATRAKYGDPLPWMPGGRDCPREDEAPQ